MYSFVERFAASDDPSTIASLEAILGGPKWRERLDQNLPRGLAVEKLFRDTLRSTGGFRYVVSTKIQKSTMNRTHFFIVFGTKNYNGLKTYRDVEYRALLEHEAARLDAKERRREGLTSTVDMFAGHQDPKKVSVVSQVVSVDMAKATDTIKEFLDLKGQSTFGEISSYLLERFQLRETNVKDICVELEKLNIVEKSWGKGQKPNRK